MNDREAGLVDRVQAQLDQHGPDDRDPPAVHAELANCYPAGRSFAEQDQPVGGPAKVLIPVVYPWIEKRNDLAGDSIECLELGMF